MSKKKRDWGLYGGGMKKHAQSGVPHNHRNSIEHTREHNQLLEKQSELRKKAKGKMYPSVQEAFKNKGF